MDVNGVTVAYDEVGDGEDVIVLVHGHPFNRSMWRPQIDAIAGAGWRVIAPDLRGYGDSTVAPGVTLLDQFARDIVALLDARGVASAVFGGLSMGGQIVMECCRHYPDRVRALLLAATFPQADTEEGQATRRSMAERLLREGMDGYATDVLPKMVAPHNIAALPDVADHVRTMMRGTSPAGAAAALRGRAERPDYQDALSRMDVPATIIVGDHDVFTTRADAERMRDLLTQSELVWLEGSGHMPNLERPAAFNEALVRLLGRARRRHEG
jgi:pimeloyl-ACP methyl ester carboxylesterase